MVLFDVAILKGMLVMHAVRERIQQFTYELLPDLDRATLIYPQRYYLITISYL